MKFGGRIRIFAGGLALLAPLARREDSPKTMVTTATTLQIRRAGKTTGAVGLAESTELDFVAIEEEFSVACSSIPTKRRCSKVFGGDAVAKNTGKILRDFWRKQPPVKA